MQGPYNNARFVATRFRKSPVDFGFIMYQKELIHAVIGFKHNVPCIVSSEALRGHSDTSVHEARSPRSHNAQYIMLKSLNNVDITYRFKEFTSQFKADPH